MKCPISRVCDIRVGSMEEKFDAWLSNFMMDNNLLHRLNPGIIASQEQLAFMVHLEPSQVYLPCSDEMFFAILADRMPQSLLRRYARDWRIVVRFLKTMPYPDTVKKRTLDFCRFRFFHALHARTAIPSRLLKRLSDIVLSVNNVLDDPWEERRAKAVSYQVDFLDSAMVREAMDFCPPDVQGGSISEMRRRTGLLELARYASLAANVRNWSEKLPDKTTLWQRFGQAERAFAANACAMDNLGGRPLTILMLCDADGGSVYDLHAAKTLTRAGHRVIYAVKDNFFFHSPTMQDVRDNPQLAKLLKGACICQDTNLSKNELLKLLREWRLLVVNDGTRERLNLSRASTTFARAWKESDLILARGWRMRETLLGTSHQFTRDILCYWQEGENIEVHFKPKAASERKFTEQEITDLADCIIEELQAARDAGKKIIFYSCIIGSIPGETQTAIRLVTAFLKDRRAQVPDAYIVNPAEHFVEGMDGDDLMYMWERVQRSGLINIWRFQSQQDIEHSFALLGETTPPVWLGKDATYSTGCTKEMHIALDVQKKNPEMQITGPDPSRFVRRSDYGVGKYFDATLAH